MTAAAVADHTVLRGLDGASLMGGNAWCVPATGHDQEVLDRAVGPVLDIGCGPGRHVVALAERGIPSLGIDITPAALEIARARGALVMERSVFERVPASGRWASALLLDGNVGIGGEPLVLLARVAQLLAPGGRLLVEVAPPGTARPVSTVRFEIAGVPGPWFHFCTVGADSLRALAEAAGYALIDIWSSSDRWFAELRTRPAGASR